MAIYLYATFIWGARMRITIIAVGNRMPHWVQEGFNTYNERLVPHHTVKLVEIPPEKRTKNNDTDHILEKETKQIFRYIENDDIVIVLDEQGELWSSPVLAQKIELWQNESRNLVFIIGSADGLSSVCKKRANAMWSLSKLVFPHPLVRVMLVEQLYRATAILMNHPYHRE